MNFSARKSTFIQIALVCLTSWAAGQETNNMLETAPMQAPAPQPQLSFDTFTGPGSSVTTEAQQPFNSVAADAVATAASTGTGSATVTDASGTAGAAFTDAASTATDAAASTVQPIAPNPIPAPRPDNKLPTPPNNGGRPPRPLPNPNQIPSGMNPLLALLKAILSGQGGIKVIGGGPGLGSMEDGPFGGQGGPGGFGGPFGGMGGPPRRVRIMILRKPRGGRLPPGLEGPGGIQAGGFGGGYGGNGGGFGGNGGGFGSNEGGFGGGSGEIGGGFGGRFAGMFN